MGGLWTPKVVADWSGCKPGCNNCGQVCPTGAIRALPLAEKRAARMGLAAVNEQTCLPHAGREACSQCVHACADAGYNAIEYVRVHVEVDEQGMPVADSGFSAPMIRADKCVGCGLCQARCYSINVKEKGLLAESAVHVQAGGDREDRMMSGSYLALREQERRARVERQRRWQKDRGGDDYLPAFLK